MTVLGLYVGVGKVVTGGEERRAVDAALGASPVPDMTPNVFRSAGRLLSERMAEAEGDGPSIGNGDAVIAATALERDEPVLAGDGRSAATPGVSVETHR